LSPSRTPSPSPFTSSADNSGDRVVVPESFTPPSRHRFASPHHPIVSTTLFACRLAFA
jgi:hypothetical protein